MDYKRENKKYYNETYRLFGEGEPRVLWQQKECQRGRFERQASFFNYTDKSVLDVGCGYGDFYFYLLEQGMRPKCYIGVDLVHSHCKVARERLPKDAIVIEGDFLEKSIQNVELAVLSGALNVYFDNWQETALLIMDKMWQLSKEAITFNIRSSHGLKGEYESKSRQIADINPSFWCEYAHQRTSRYGLYHDYVHYDYTVAMWKAPPNWEVGGSVV